MRRATQIALLAALLTDCSLPVGGGRGLAVGYEAKLHCYRVLKAVDIAIDRCGGDFRESCDEVVGEFEAPDQCIEALEAMPCWQFADVWNGVCQIFQRQ